MEKKVNELIEESCFANDRGEFPLVSYSVLLYNKQLLSKIQFYFLSWVVLRQPLIFRK